MAVHMQKQMRGQISAGYNSQYYCNVLSYKVEVSSGEAEVPKVIDFVNKFVRRSGLIKEAEDTKLSVKTEEAVFSDTFNLIINASVSGRSAQTVDKVKHLLEHLGEAIERRFLAQEVLRE